MSEALRQKLAQQIERAFSDAVYPGDPYIGREDVDDFVGKHWREVSPDLVRKHWLDLPMFTAEGAWFYLPAYMLAALLYPVGGDPIPFSIVFYLSPYSLPERHTRELLELAAYFSAEQIEVVLCYLLALPELEPDGQWTSLRFEYKEILETAFDFWAGQLK